MWHSGRDPPTRSAQPQRCPTQLFYGRVLRINDLERPVVVLAMNESDARDRVRKGHVGEEGRMSEPRGFDLDGETSRDWTSFARRLADRLADMSDGDTLTLGLGGTDHDAQPGMAVIAFSALHDGLLRRTEHAPDDEITGEQVVRRRDVDQLAAETVRLLRDVHGVMHPAFLRVSGDSELVDGGDRGSGTGLSAISDGALTAEVTEPVDAAHLLELAFATITHDLGREPGRDVDGDIVLVLEVEDARAVHRELTADGVRFLADPYEPPWGGCRFFCIDPDSYLVEIEQPA